MSARQLSVAEWSVIPPLIFPELLAQIHSQPGEPVGCFVRLSFIDLRDMAWNKSFCIVRRIMETRADTMPGCSLFVDGSALCFCLLTKGASDLKSVRLQIGVPSCFRSGQCLWRAFGIIRRLQRNVTGLFGSGTKVLSGGRIIDLDYAYDIASLNTTHIRFTTCRLACTS